MTPFLKQLQQLKIKPINSFVKFNTEEVEQSITERFQQVVRQYGDRLAINTREHQLTYHTLNQIANRIARTILSQQGEGSEPIALLFTKGAPIVAAMLGVLKAGKFYVPIDSSLPKVRITYILQNSQAKLLLTDNTQIELAKELSQQGLEIINIDLIDSQLSPDNLEIIISPESLAYIIYTSGSTGQPKGVMQNHRYVLNLTKNYTNSSYLSIEDRFALLYSPGFGGAVRDIYCALLNGAALFPFDVKQEGLTQLGDWLNEQEITIFFAVATMFRHFAQSLTGDEKFPHLRLIQIGSETVYRQDVQLYQQHFSDECILVVNLGGTEISPICQFFVDKNTQIESSTVPVGYAVEGVEILLLDEQGQSVGKKEVGEIVVKSPYMCVGYWHKPDLTETTFLPDPLGSDARLYKTGDLGCLLPDGCLLHLGRKDFQVKIRGYRVDVTEVEMALLKSNQIREVAVTASGDRFGEQRLVAYLVPTQAQQPPSPRQLRHLLSDTLPDYMIPSLFAILEALPLAPNGKLDRRALPDPNQIERTCTDFVAPRTSVEQKLVVIWSQVLEIEVIGIEDNFFQLGGHSLLASRVLVRIADAFSIHLPVKTIFESPTIAQLAVQIENINQSTSQELPTASICLAPISRSSDFPLSLAQQRLWFLHQIEENKGVYNLFRAFRLTGQINETCLEQSVQTIIERHEILRTTFTLVNGSPVQVIAPVLCFGLSVVDVQNLPAAERTYRVEQIITDVQTRFFDLTHNPLFRVTLVHLDAQNHLLLIAMHHIITDDWSMQVFLKELSALYTAFVQKKPSPLPELTIQYADYAHWQRQWLQGEVLNKQLNYWRQQLADSPPLLELPTDYPRLAEQSFQGGVISFHLERKLTHQLKVLSQESGTTLFITLLAAFAILLSRYSHQEDVVVGTGIANRNPTVTEQFLGFFVNTLALRIRLSDNPTFSDFLKQVHQNTLDAYAHPDVPFDRLVETLPIERHLSHSPIFQVMFILQNVTKEELVLPGLTTTLIELDQPTAGATFDLTVSLKETEAGLRGTFEYNQHLFESATIKQMAGHFQTLLEGIIEHPKQAVGYLPLLCASEREELLRGRNSLKTTYSPTQCLHQWFEDRVENTPNAIAVKFIEQKLTYKELNERANQLAHHLQTLGVKPETLVGICVERSLEMIVGLLGILKAGGAYVPLDPTYPQERSDYILKDSQVQVLVTQSHLLNTLPCWEKNIVCLDTDWETICQYSVQNVVSEVQAKDLAYIIYTSGSTGQPKGVLVTHQNVTRLFTATESWYHFHEDDVWTMFHSYAFDFSVWELWGALLYGGRVVIIPQDISRDPKTFYNLLVSEKVTVLNQTPSAFYQLIRVDEHSKIQQQLSLRLVIFGGEALDLPSLKPWFDRYGDQYPQLVNMYGITETTVHVTYRPLSLADVTATGSLIGVPIPDLQIYLLDQYQQPVPTGVRGEMYVGGSGVTGGYLNRPELTALRFISHPFDEPNGKHQLPKLYKTGDLARYLRNGELEYLGRIDHQVKIRGFRIELGEIEALLSQHPDVRECVVLAREDEPNNKRLVAYIVPDRTQASTILNLVRLREQGVLSDRSLYELPNGMVIAHLNKTETEFLYQEIFAAKSYLQHGITLNEGDCIFDVGANIGLFTLFAAQSCPKVKIYAFEPIPPVFELLRLNAELYNLDAKVFNIGLSGETKSVEFTYYPHVSVISGRFADAFEEKEVVKSFLLKQQAVTGNGTNVSQEILDELLAERLQSEQFTCQLKTISNIIAENQIERIDLLKIDVEKSERDVLAGIQEKDWSKIQQIIVEVHDINGRLAEITELLKFHGYDLTIVQDNLLEETPLYNIYAIRKTIKQRFPQKTAVNFTGDRQSTWNSLERYIQDLRYYLKKKLPDYMIPSAFVVLEKFPLTSNGKVDSRTLPPPNLEFRTEGTYEIPQTEVEKQITVVWQKILGVEKVGIHDNFFEIGGHSLLLAQTHQQLQDLFDEKLSIVEMFRYPTIHTLAKRFSQHLPTQSSTFPEGSQTPLRHDRQDLLKQQRQRRQKQRPPK